MDDSAAQYIRLRWAGICNGCGRELQRGVWAWHDRSSRSVSCAECVTRKVHAELDIVPTSTEDSVPVAQAAASIDRGVAGAGARAKYEYLRAARDDHVRRRFGGLGVAVTRLAGDPQHIAAWKAGAQGEERVGARLAKLLAGKGVVVLHDRRPATSLANIDHLAIGPGGITVIDAKNVKGDVRIERSGGLFGPRTTRLTIGGRDRSRLVEGVERQVAEVAAALVDLGFDRVGVLGVMCFVKADGLPLMRRLQVRDVELLGFRGTAKLAARPGALPHTMVEAIAKRLAVRLPASSGH